MGTPNTDIANQPTRAKPTLTELARLIIRATKMGLRVGIPGRVIAFDSSTQLAKVQTEILAVRRETRTNTPLAQKPLVLDHVPVSFPNNSAGAGLAFPIVPGTTTGELRFMDRSIARWLETGAPSEPDNAALHALHDCIFVPGLNPKTNALSFFDPAAAVLEAALIKVGFGATEAAVLGSAFLTLYNAHTHTAPAGGGPTSVPVVPMVAGTHTSTSVLVKG